MARNTSGLALRKTAVGLFWLLLVMSDPYEGFAARCGPTYGADGIAVDSGGNVWITHFEDVRVARLNPALNRFEEFLPTVKANPVLATQAGRITGDAFDYSFDSGFSGLTIDEKQRVLWTARFSSNKLVRFSLKDKSFSEIALPAQIFEKRGPVDMDSGGNIWVLTATPSEKGLKEGRIVKVSPNGGFKEFPVPVREFTGWGMTLDAVGRPWITLTPAEEGRDIELYALKKGRFERRKLAKAGRYITSLAFDSRGALWFAAPEVNAIGRLAQGKLTMFPVPTAGSFPSQVSIDRRSNVWFTEWDGHRIGRLSPDGKFREYPIPPEEESPLALAFDRDGGVWFSVLHNYNLFRLDPKTGAMKEYAVPAPANWSEDAASASSACAIASRDAAVETARPEPLKPLRHPKGHEENPQAGLFEKSCHTGCHTWYRVDKASARRADWSATVDRMIEQDGATFISKTERDKIVRYLNMHYTPGAGKTGKGGLKKAD